VSPATAWSEVRARERLAGAGIPVVPGRLAKSADEAVDAASAVGRPVAVKISSDLITHKSDVGGVALGLASDEEIRAAYARVTAAAARAGDDSGSVLVTAMRTGGVELLAGVSVDPGFGPVLAVGLGGIFVEVLRDVSLRVLPADADEVGRMLGELRGLPVLTGGRGSAPVDLEAVAKVISDIGELAASVPGLRACEVNPLWVRGDQIEALDVLVVTQPGGDDEYCANGTEPGR
jgi:acetate---CoA ligase (ADP-forming)